jgi:hypothetical protein
MKIENILCVVFVCILTEKVSSFPQTSKQLAIATKQTELTYYNSDVS